MEIYYERRFNKDLKKIREKQIKARIQKKIEEIEPIVLNHEPEDEQDIPKISNMIKMEGFEYHYRIRVGDYRLGVSIEIKIEEEENTFYFLRCLHRKDIYKKFP